MKPYDPTYRDGVGYQVDMGCGRSFDIAYRGASSDELLANFKKFFPIVKGMLVLQANLEIIGSEIGAYGYVRYMPLRKAIKKFRKALTKILGDKGWEALCQMRWQATCQAEATSTKANLEEGTL